MSKLFIASATVLALVLGVAGVQAHQGNQGMTFEGHGHHDQGNPAMNGWMPNMMGSGMMMSPDMMVVMMVADGGGSVSADEFQALHARMFEYLDANGDGKIEAGELGTTSSERSGDASE